MLGIDKPSLALSLMLLATLVASSSTNSNKKEKILMVAEGKILTVQDKKILMVLEGRCRGRLIRVSRSECTGLFMDPTFRFINSWFSKANDEPFHRWYGVVFSLMHNFLSQTFREPFQRRYCSRSGDLYSIFPGVAVLSYPEVCVPHLIQHFGFTPESNVWREQISKE